MKKLKQQLTEDEFNRFLYNAFINKKAKLIYEYIFIEESCPRLLVHSFSWMYTVEGGDYWYTLHFKYLEMVYK